MRSIIQNGSDDLPPNECEGAIQGEQNRWKQTM